MEYFKQLNQLHQGAGDLLAQVIEEKKQIVDLEENQSEFRNLFGSTNPIFANELLRHNRRLKLLFRSYKKILKQINF